METYHEVRIASEEQAMKVLQDYVRGFEQLRRTAKVISKNVDLNRSVVLVDGMSYRFSERSMDCIVVEVHPVATGIKLKEKK